jgi:guanylate kinase
LKMDSPKLVNSFEDDTFEDIDLVSYFEIKEEYEKCKEIEQAIAPPKNKLFKKRNKQRKRDPTKSVWYLDCLLEEYGTFKDENQADGNLFRYRFNHSFASVQSIARKISEKEHRFWRIRMSLEGKNLLSLL